MVKEINKAIGKVMQETGLHYKMVMNQLGFKEMIAEVNKYYVNHLLSMEMISEEYADKLLQEQGLRA
ncbi:hypothetical protein ABET51_06705 [Metabacillus fastidiosus]|uniref:hypothetical protein n=1 Tax=Metabacillus fastidiosus TaxID=1458 RepID=UPI003D2C110D